jgi:histidine decarboxylase
VIASICDTAGVARYIHADAALSGIPLACAEPHLRPGFDLSDGADSISCSGHKMLPAMPSAVFLSRRAYLAESAMPVDYLRCLDMTVSGSRHERWHPCL